MNRRFINMLLGSPQKIQEPPVIFLGNIGERYTTTRHNVAWVVADELVGHIDDWHHDKYLSSLVATIDIDGEGTTIKALKPTTLMNNSGSVIGLLKKQYRKWNTQKLVVVHDDIDLKIGEFKISVNRGPANHNGVISVASALGSNDYIRIRIGIGHPGPIPMKNYVLMQLDPGELAKVRALAPRIKRSLAMIIKEGAERAMNEFNTK